MSHKKSSLKEDTSTPLENTCQKETRPRQIFLQTSAMMSVWYLPHHPVIHPYKPSKVRVVFDSVAKCKGVCLNNALNGGLIINITNL